jgi:hypothetical protein
MIVADIPLQGRGILCFSMRHFDNSQELIDRFKNKNRILIISTSSQTLPGF